MNRCATKKQNQVRMQKPWRTPSWNPALAQKTRKDGAPTSVDEIGPKSEVLQQVCLTAPFQGKIQAVNFTKNTPAVDAYFAGALAKPRLYTGNCRYADSGAIPVFG